MIFLQMALSVLTRPLIAYGEIRAAISQFSLQKTEPGSQILTMYTQVSEISYPFDQFGSRARSLDLNYACMWVRVYANTIDCLGGFDGT